MKLNTKATFDVLYITCSLQRTAGGVVAAELHLFAYLACVLWLYSGRAADNWGYTFVGTELGAPYSRHIDSAIGELATRGFLVDPAHRMQPSALARNRLNAFQDLQLNRERVDCLRAACASTSVFSLGMIGGALAQDPELKRARAVALTRELLGSPAQASLYRHFEALRKSLPQRDMDLRVPAVVWLAALYEIGRGTGS